MCQGFTTKEETNGYEGLHCGKKIHPPIQVKIWWLSTSGEIKLSTSMHIEDHQKRNMFYHFWKETLQDGSITHNGVAITMPGSSYPRME